MDRRLAFPPCAIIRPSELREEGWRAIAFLLGCEKVRVDFPTKEVFSEVSLGVDRGDQVGIVGRNGDGKFDAAEPVGRHAGARRRPRAAQRRRARGRAGTGRLAPIPLPRWGASRGGAICLNTSGPATRIRDIILPGWPAISPGTRRWERCRAGSAVEWTSVRLLIGDWDVLALDEPTNHLDMRAITWLADHPENPLEKRARARAVGGHARPLVPSTRVCLRMWEVHDKRVEPFEGRILGLSLQRVEARSRENPASRAETPEQALRRELAWLSRGHGRDATTEVPRGRRPGSSSPTYRLCATSWSSSARAWP